MLKPTATEIVLILTGAMLFGVGIWLALQSGRLLARLQEVIGYLGVLSAQSSQLNKREKRIVQLLEDIRAGRGESGDLARTFSEAEEQKVAFYQLHERTDSPQGQTLAEGIRKTAIKLYQDIIERFPESQEAEVARERIAQFESIGKQT
jgi:hypothetical protein